MAPPRGQETVAQTAAGRSRASQIRAVCGALDDAAAGFRAGAADRLREPGQPAVDAHYGEDREMSVRLALGAGRGRLIRQLLTESTVVAFLGGIAGLGAAWIFRAGLLRLIPDTIHVPGAPDARVLASPSR